MEMLLPRVKEIAEKVVQKEKDSRAVAEKLRKNSGLFQKIRLDDNNDFKVVGVDGGIVKKTLHGFDLVLARAVAVCFHCNKDRVSRVEYFPSRIPNPHAFIFDNLQETDFTYSASTIRQTTEIGTAIESVEKFRPSLLLLDGSIVPHYADKPGKDSQVYKDYENLIGLYKNLYKACEKNNTLLACVVEDSRGTRFCETVKAFLPKDPCLRDTSLLFWMLKKGERTKTFPYSENPKGHHVLVDFEGYKINSFYIKTADMDRPIRIDFLGNDADRIASVVFSLSARHSSYGIPSVLIEADHAAKLSEEDAENFYNHIVSHTGILPSVFKLRRDTRPF